MQTIAAGWLRLMPQAVRDQIMISQMEWSDQKTESDLERRVRWYNESEGNLTGFDCSRCRNKGSISYIQDGHEYSQECECMRTRIAMHKAAEYMKRSGTDLYADTFENYQCLEEWQINVKSATQRYVADVIAGNKKWLYLGGQNGAGKTHLCTAVCGELFKNQIPVMFYSWRNLVQKLESMRFDSEYEKFISHVQNVDILFIDDLLKQKDKNKIPGELTLAFEILDARSRADRITIISSEWLLNDLFKLDAGLAGRIKNMSQLVQIAYADGRDWRARKGGIK